MSFVLADEVVLASAVANAGTVTVAYPGSSVQADFIGANAAPNTGRAVLNGNEIFPEAASGVRIGLSYGASNVTVTNNTGISWPAGSRLRVQFGRAGADRPGFRTGDAITSLTTTVGTAADALVDVTATPTQTTINNNFASVQRKIEQILIALRTLNVIQ